MEETIVKYTPQFSEWLGKVKDPKGKASITFRVQRMKFGMFGDVEPVGNGVSELRVHIGKGYRVYFKRQNKEIIVLLCGGDKSTQTKDIKRAKQIANELGL